VQLANEPEPIPSAAPPLAETVATGDVSAVPEQFVTAPVAADEEPVATAGPATEGTAEASSPLLRAAYVLIFLLTVLASYTVWPQAGGQGHLDLMPWYWKLFPPLVFSYSIVKASIAAGSEPKTWNRGTRAWLIMALLCAGLIGGLTYYYHLTEAQDQVDSDEGIMTSVEVPEHFPRA